MNLEQIEALARELGWPDEHLSFIADSMRQAVDLRIIPDAARPDASRFGGDPYVPRGFAWPSHAVGQYRFLGQIDFSQLSPPSTALPASGLLSLFYAYDEDGEVFWQDDGYVLAYYWEDLSDHVLMPTPDGVRPSPEAGVELVAGFNLPRHEELRADWPFEDAADFAWDLSQDVNAEHYLLGYPSYCTLGYDPTPGPEWTPLLTLGSDDALDWCWHDGDRLMVFIRTDHLKARNFSALQCDAG